MPRKHADLTRHRMVQCNRKPRPTAENRVPVSPQTTIPGPPPTCGFGSSAATRASSAASRASAAASFASAASCPARAFAAISCTASSSSRRTRSRRAQRLVDARADQRLGLVAQSGQRRERPAGHAGEIVEEPWPLAPCLPPDPSARLPRRADRPVYPAPMILVTGGAGFIGSNLHAALDRRGHETVVVDRLGSEGKWRNLRNHPPARLLPPEDARRLPRRPPAAGDGVPSRRDQRDHGDRRRPGLGHQCRAAAAPLALVRGARRAAGLCLLGGDLRRRQRGLRATGSAALDAAAPAQPLRLEQACLRPARWRALLAAGGARARRNGSG